MKQAKPFVKWMGGKRVLIDFLRGRMKNDYTNYYECFLGGGALFFDVNPKRAVLNDINSKLISTYKAIKEDVNLVIKKLKVHYKKNRKEYYFEMRKELIKETNQIELASLFLYLNRFCFNGLYRESKKGNFNIGFGETKTSTEFLREENLIRCSEALKKTTLLSGSYKDVPIEKGAFYYLDPPYFQKFSYYNKSGFNLEAHKNLRDYCIKIKEAGAYFMLSNSNTKEIVYLFRNFKIETFDVKQPILRRVEEKTAKEVLIRNY